MKLVACDTKFSNECHLAQMSKVPIIFGYAYSCKLGVSQKNATFFARKGA
jgi:hypothetical protein